MTIDQLSANQLFILLVAVLVLILPNWFGIWHAWRRDFSSTNEKMIWIGLCVFVPILGGLAYLLLGRPRGKKPLA